MQEKGHFSGESIRLFNLKSGIITVIFLVVALQIAWFASLPPFSIHGLTNVDFVDLSNYGQFLTSFLCTALAIYLYSVPPRRDIYLLTGFASGLWFLSNLYWFLYVNIMGNALLYPCIADVGFLGVFLLLATALGLTFERKRIGGTIKTAVYSMAFIIPAAVAVLSPTAQSLSNIFYCLFASVLMLAVIENYDKRYIWYFIGASGYCAAMLAYSLRETYFPGNTIFTIVGQLASVSFCLIALGLIRFNKEGRAC